MRALPLLETRLPVPPEAPLYHRFQSKRGSHLLVVPYSQIYDVLGDGPSESELLGLTGSYGAEAPLDAMVAPAPQAISLNVSSSCNLSCGYCYAGQGSFSGAQSGRMTAEVAETAVNRLFEGADSTRPVIVGFMGGEPFVNRTLIHHVVGFAERRARQAGLEVRFSVTTNGTLLEPSDLELLRARPFAVTISVDGGAAVQDAQRPRSRLRGSFSELNRRVAPLLESPGQARVSARATVSAPFSDLRSRFESLVEMGFEQVGFSPVRVSPKGALEPEDWPRYLEELSVVARAEAERAQRGEPIRLVNLLVALEQLRRGAASPYPCGAGGGYFSVSADGRWYACHRGVGQAEFELGDAAGLDSERRTRFLARGHVHAQAACGSCFARYLCSGGCHHEASARSESSCGFIRGWLELCLATFCELEAI
ncbi:MAG TPA: radical SAM protein [Polyangiaceae bacterium]|nr:radical SAM protein [Polyangiaceae bacterium]